MSFIIKGLDFPKTCGDCPCCVEYDNGVCIYSDDYNTGMFCSAQDCAPDIYDIDKKLSSCPIVEIPTPHGRLIDADALHEKADSQPTFWKGAIDEIMVREAPTIIEAEELNANS